MMSKVILPSLFAFVVLLTMGTAQAELPSVAYDQLQGSAKEVLALQVTNVKTTSNVTSDPCYQRFSVNATVLFPVKSATGILKGCNVTFLSYYYNKTNKLCPAFSGPIIPPLLERGWCGLVYLNHTENSTTLNIAAYGKSFYDYMYNGVCDFKIFGDDANNLDDDSLNND